MTWQILEAYPVRRGSLDGSREATTAWRPSPHFAPQPTAAAAKRALMVALAPELAAVGDAAIARHYLAWQRNVGAHRLLRIAA